VIDLKNSGLSGHIYRYFRISFHDLLFKNQAAEVSYYAVTLQMMRNNRRSSLVINDNFARGGVGGVAGWVLPCFPSLLMRGRGAGDSSYI
jgi:hypothetical protein